MTTAPPSTDKNRMAPWALFVLIGLALVALILLVPQLAFQYSAHWGYTSLKRLFYQDLSLSDSISTFFATVLSFIYALSWLPAIAFAPPLIGRMNIKRLAIAFFSYVFVYGAAPLLEGVFGTDVCFNQATGESEKWYVVHRDGTVALFDSSGFDSEGVAKKPVTTEICQIYEQQKKGGRAHQITSDPRKQEFFRADNGRPLVWYDVDAAGKVRLFDGPGFDPDTSDPLRPITKQIVARVLADTKTQEEAAEAAQNAVALAAEQQSAKEAAELAARCFSTAPCSPILQGDGTTEPVAVPPGKNTCFDPSFWKNIDSLGYQTSYRSSGYVPFSCTKEQVIARTCDVKLYDHFRFTPQEGTILPNYWFIPAGTRKC
jgi:hypothetical protein